MKKSEKRSDSLLKRIWTVYSEKYYVHKALRLLKKQEWSIEFLEAMLLRAARHSGTEIEMAIVNTSGNTILLRTIDKISKGYLESTDNVFDHLDDSVAVNNFIKEIE